MATPPTEVPPSPLWAWASGVTFHSSETMDTFIKIYLFKIKKQRPNMATFETS